MGSFLPLYSLQNGQKLSMQVIIRSERYITKTLKWLLLLDFILAVMEKKI